MRAVRLVVYVFLIARLAAPAASASAAVARPRAAVALVRASGIVQIKRAGSDEWRLPASLPLGLGGGDQIRTGAKASAVVDLRAGARVELGAYAVVAVAAAEPGYAGTLDLSYGALAAAVDAQAPRLRVRTPSAAASGSNVRFRVEAAAGGRASFETLTGALAVEDRHGAAVVLEAGKTLRVDLRGLGTAGAAPTEVQRTRDVFRDRMRRELGFERDRVELEASLPRSARLSELRQGRVLVDASGERVRVEQFVMRPAADQFALVTLNGRGGRVDSFAFVGQLNRPAPTELSAVLRQLTGTADAAPTWYLTGYTATRSNGTDRVVERAAGGHPVDVNHNADPADDAAAVYDASSDRWLGAAGRSVYLTLFDQYGLYVDGALKRGWAGTNLQQYSDAVPAAASGLDPFSGSACGVTAGTLSTVFPGADARRLRYESYLDGTSVQWDESQLTPVPRTATRAEFGGAAAGSSYQRGALRFGFEQTITASELGGRKIDLLLAPKIMLQLGLLP